MRWGSIRVDMFMRNRIQKYKSKIPFTSNYLGGVHHRRGQAHRLEREMAQARRHGRRRKSTASAWRWAAIHSGPGLGAATIRLNPDGTAHVLVGVTDIGTGAKIDDGDHRRGGAGYSAEPDSSHQRRYRRDALFRRRVGQPHNAVYRPGGDRRGGRCAPANFRSRRAGN